MSKSGTCYYIKDDLTAGSGTGTTYSSTTTAADCTGTKAAAATYTSSW
jgi:hypothetical protein